MGLLSCKDIEAFDIFQAWKVKVEKEIGMVVKTLHTDHGGGHTSDSFGTYYTKEVIEQQKTTTRSTQQKKAAE